MTTWRIVGTGDSILGITLDITSPGLAPLLTEDRCIDAEYGRNVHTRGLANRASHTSIWPLVTSRSQPGGWILFQDNALGTTEKQWRTWMHQIADTVPNDRALLGITPVFHPKWGPTAAHHTQTCANHMIDIFRTHPTHAIIRWDLAVHDNPALVYDGQHPNIAGRQWLRTEIERWINP